MRARWNRVARHGNAGPIDQHPLEIVTQLFSESLRVKRRKRTQTRCHLITIIADRILSVQPHPSQSLKPHDEKPISHVTLSKSETTYARVHEPSHRWFRRGCKRNDAQSHGGIIVVERWTEHIGFQLVGSEELSVVAFKATSVGSTRAH